MIDVICETRSLVTEMIFIEAFEMCGFLSCDLECSPARKKHCDPWSIFLAPSGTLRKLDTPMFSSNRLIQPKGKIHRLRPARTNK
jgi:hypothetical protein